MTVYIQKWTPFRLACAMRSLQQGVNAGTNRQIARLALLAKAIAAAFTAPFALTTFATATGTTGQFSFGATPSTIVVGQIVTITGANTGTGTISPYTSGQAYLVSVTNGSTSATLTTLSGGALTTVAGTLTGLTGTLSSWAKWRVGFTSLTSSAGLMINVPLVPGFVPPVGTSDDST